MREGVFDLSKSREFALDEGMFLTELEALSSRKIAPRDIQAERFEEK